MAARTPTLKQFNVGSNRLIIATFTDIDDNDTWESNITEIVAYWVNATDDPTAQGKEKIDASVSDATPDKPGIFTFYTGEDDRTGMVYVLSRV